VVAPLVIPKPAISWAPWRRWACTLDPNSDPNREEVVTIREPSRAFSCVIFERERAWQLVR